MRLSLKVTKIYAKEGGYFIYYSIIDADRRFFKTVKRDLKFFKDTPCDQVEARLMSILKEYRDDKEREEKLKLVNEASALIYTGKVYKE